MKEKAEDDLRLNDRTSNGDSDGDMQIHFE